MMMGHELSCISNHLGGGPNVDLMGSTLPSPKGLDK